MPTVFVSHRLADADAAERLATDIRAAGHLVRLDAWELLVGDSIPGWMNEALGAAKYVVACYSTAGVDSPWMSREWLSALARQLDKGGVKLLPVRLTAGDPPTILADLKYADLVADWPRGVRDLLRSIR